MAGAGGAASVASAVSALGAALTPAADAEGTRSAVEREQPTESTAHKTTKDDRICVSSPASPIAGHFSGRFGRAPRAYALAPSLPFIFLINPPYPSLAMILWNWDL